LDEVVEGVGTGHIAVDIVNPVEIESGADYRVEFVSEGEYSDYQTAYYNIYRVEPDTSILLEGGIDVDNFGDDFPSPPVEGLVVKVYNDTALVPVPDETGWLIGSTNLNVHVERHTANLALSDPWPADYKLTFYDDYADTTLNNIPVKFKVRNLTEDRDVQIGLFDKDGSGTLTMLDVITIIEYKGNQPRYAWDIVYDPPIFPVTPVEPQPGDEFIIRTQKQFKTGDYFEFSTKAPRQDQELAKNELDLIKVVPNPYVLGASWERRTLFSSGRGERKIDFIHLPSRCTIRIFTLSGALVKTINHDNMMIDGAESWNLISDDGMEIAYGVYVYHVEAPKVGNYIGKFAIIK
ncbi:MAG: hypothetical protein WAN36_01385, partial [Calditrichia bacterium]